LKNLLIKKKRRLNSYLTVPLQSLQETKEKMNLTALQLQEINEKIAERNDEEFIYDNEYYVLNQKIEELLVKRKACERMIFNRFNVTAVLDSLYEDYKEAKEIKKAKEDLASAEVNKKKYGIYTVDIYSLKDKMQIKRTDVTKKLLKIDFDRSRKIMTDQNWYDSNKKKRING